MKTTLDRHITSEKIEILLREVAAAKIEFSKFFDANGNFISPDTKSDPEFLATREKSQLVDRELREDICLEKNVCSVAIHGEREANRGQLAALKLSSERDARTPVFSKTQAQLDAEYDEDLKVYQE